MDGYQICSLLVSYIGVAAFVGLFCLPDANVDTLPVIRVKMALWPLLALYYLPKWGLLLVLDIIKGFVSVLLKTKTKD